MATMLWVLTVIVGVVALMDPGTAFGRRDESLDRLGSGWFLWVLFGVLMIASIVAMSDGPDRGEDEPYDVAQDVGDHVAGTYDSLFRTPSQRLLEERAQEQSDGKVRVAEREVDGDHHHYEFTAVDGDADPACLTVTVPHPLGQAADPIEVTTEVAAGTCD